MSDRCPMCDETLDDRSFTADELERDYLKRRGLSAARGGPLEIAEETKRVAQSAALVMFKTMTAAYRDALRGGCDSNGAYDCMVQASDDLLDTNAALLLVGAARGGAPAPDADPSGARAVDWHAGVPGAPAVPSEAAIRAFDTELDLLLWHEHRVNMNRDGKVAKALVANRDESRRRLTELFKARMGALEAALRGLACHCCADPEGHEATDHLTFGEREVFEQARGPVLAPAPSGAPAHEPPPGPWFVMTLASVPPRFRLEKAHDTTAPGFTLTDSAEATALCALLNRVAVGAGDALRDRIATLEAALAEIRTLARSGTSGRVAYSFCDEIEKVARAVLSPETSKEKP